MDFCFCLQVHPLVINPKSVTLSELYGAYDLATFEWADGILSTMFKQSAESDKPDEKVNRGVIPDEKCVACAGGVPLENGMFLCRVPQHNGQSGCAQCRPAVVCSKAVVRGFGGPTLL